MASYITSESGATKALDDLAAKIRAGVANTAASVRHSVDQAAEVGRLLDEAKGRVGHGNWLNWLRVNCHLSERSAQGYMRISRNRAELDSKAQSVADLTISGALSLLSEPKPEPALVRDAIVIGDSVPVDVWRRQFEAAREHPCTVDEPEPMAEGFRQMFNQCIYLTRIRTNRLWRGSFDSWEHFIEQVVVTPAESQASREKGRDPVQDVDDFLDMMLDVARNIAAKPEAA